MSDAKFTNHNTDDRPAVCILPDGTVHTFGWVSFLTGEAAQAYLQSEVGSAESIDQTATGDYQEVQAP